MAQNVKPIVEIDIDDSKFQRFYELFSHYTDEVQKQPEAWRALGEAVGQSSQEMVEGAMSAKEAFALAAAQAGLISEAIRDAVKEQRQLDLAARASGSSMNVLSDTTKSASSNVSGLTKMLSILPGWGKVAALGIGAFTAAVDTASAAFTRYKAAGSLGLSPGQLSSFQVNAQQFLGPSAIESAANAQSDLSKAGLLAALGISYDKATTMSASDLAFQELKNAAQAYKANPHAFMQTPQGRAYLELGGNMDDVRNAAAHVGELNNAWWRTNHDTAAMNFSDKTGQNMTNFKVAVDRASRTLQTKLIDGVALAAPTLTHFANGATDAATALDGPHGLAHAAQSAAAALYRAAGDKKAANKVLGDRPGVDALMGAGGPPGALLAAIVVPGVESLWDRFHPKARAAAASAPKARGSIGPLGSIDGLDIAAARDAITGIESGGSYSVVNPDTQATGRYQFIPGTAADNAPEWFKAKYKHINDGLYAWGNKDAEAAFRRNDRGVQDETFKNYFEMLEAHAKKRGHPGDIRAIAAGWNGGMAAEDKYIDAMYGASPRIRAAALAWLNATQHIGAHDYTSVAGYYGNVAATYGRLTGKRRAEPHPRVHVVVTNKSGNNVAVSANAAGVH